MLRSVCVLLKTLKLPCREKNQVVNPRAVLLLAGNTLEDGIEDGNRAADALVRGAALDKFVQRDFSVTIAVHFLWGRKKANKKNVRVQYRRKLATRRNNVVK